MSIKVYGKPGCSGCKQLVAQLTAKAVEFEYIDVSLDEAAYSELVKQGFRSVPQVKVNDEWVSEGSSEWLIANS